jgi:hypothetical protein
LKFIYGDIRSHDFENQCRFPHAISSMIIISSTCRFYPLYERHSKYCDRSDVTITTAVNETMPVQTTHRPTVGFICTWPVYQGTTLDRYARSLIQGISAAASEQGCNLLLGCGFSATGNSSKSRSFWPAPGPNVSFVPVGPWNTDGLIIVPDDLTREQSQYVRDLLASGFPVIFTTPEGPGPVVAVDNTLGIWQAFQHLLQHGHKQIAFLARDAARYKVHRPGGRGKWMGQHQLRGGKRLGKSGAV